MSDSDLNKQMLEAHDAPSSDGALMTGLPHCHAMGMEILSTAAGEATLRLPYRDELVGDPLTKVLGGGAITTLLDTCCGTAVISAERGILSTATLDLRIDYMRPATPGTAVIAHAECYRVTRTVAFVRASAYHVTAQRPIATAAAAFILERAPDATKA